MKLREEVKIQIPEELKEMGMDRVSLTAKYYEQRGASDFIEIHVFQPEGVDKERMSKFRVTNANENECAYVQTRGRSEPWEMAIMGLNLYGWDCTNYTPRDERTRKQKFEERDSHLTSSINVFSNIAADYEDDPLAHEALLECAAYASIAQMLLKFRYENEVTMYDALNSEGKAAMDSMEFTHAYPEQKQRIIKRFSALLKEHSDVDAVLDKTGDDDE